MGRPLFERRREKILLEEQDLNERIHNIETGRVNRLERLAEFLELAGSAYLRYESGVEEEKRELRGIVTSNRKVEVREPVFTLSEPFRLIADRSRSTNGAPYRDRPRTFDGLLRKLTNLFEEQVLRRAPIGDKCGFRLHG